MLAYDQFVPEHVAEGAPLIVLMHGRGSDKGDLMGLQPALPPDAIVVAPRAPFPGAPWGYGEGWAWYRFLGGSTPEPASFEAGQAAIDAFLDELPGRLPVRTGVLFLGGFSQGGTAALGYALRHPGRVKGLLLFSGFLPSHAAVAATAETVAGTRFFWGHGTADPMIPFELARQGRAALAAAGADLTTGDYPIGHTIAPRELADAVAWLADVGAATPARAAR